MKTNFKKLFVSILACISVVPSANFKVAAVEEVDINNAQDWIDISNRIVENKQYTKGKYFVINNDIVLNPPNIHASQNNSDWFDLFGTLNGNNHTITLAGDWSHDSLISNIHKGGEVINVKFSGSGSVCVTNQGLIYNCELAHSPTSDGVFACNNTGSGRIQNCIQHGSYIVRWNWGTIVNCSLRVNDARMTALQFGAPDVRIGFDDVWDSAPAQSCIVEHNDYSISSNDIINGTIINCQIIHQRPQHN